LYASFLGEKSVPTVTEVENLNFWFSSKGFASMAKDYKAVPPTIQQLVETCYMCFYCKASASWFS